MLGGFRIVQAAFLGGVVMLAAMSVTPAQTRSPDVGSERSPAPARKQEQAPRNAPAETVGGKKTAPVGQAGVPTKGKAPTDQGSTSVEKGSAGGGKGKPPTDKGKGSGSSAATLTDAELLEKLVSDYAMVNFVDEHAVCTAYFAVDAVCRGEDDPERPRGLGLAGTLMGRLLAYEKELGLPAGVAQERAESAKKAFLDGMWTCSNTQVIADHRIPCLTLAEDPDDRMKKHMQAARLKVAAEIEEERAKQALSQGSANAPASAKQ